MNNVYHESRRLMAGNGFRRLVCLLLAGLLSTVSMASASAEQNQSESENTHEYETGVYYRVRSGDTLWDISKRFFDSPFYWPDLWGENKQILNPHWIYPGNRIRLHQGITGFHVTVPKPIVETAPETITEMQPAPEKPSAYFMFPPIDRIGFIRPSPLQASGTIIRELDGKQLIRPGDTIYIRKLSDQPLEPGARFTIFRTIRHHGLPNSAFSGGYQHYLVGVVQITINEPRFAVGKVVQAYRSIHETDLLTPYQERSPNIEITESKWNTTGKIIGSEENQGIMGDQTVAFIDKGSHDGMEPGQMYQIFYPQKMRLSKFTSKEIGLTPMDIGSILLLQTEDRTATVLIISASRAISPGAMFRTPPDSD